MAAQAVESLEAALSQRRDQRVLFRLGGVLFGLQQYSGARTAYQSALQARRSTHALLLHNGSTVSGRPSHLGTAD